MNLHLTWLNAFLYDSQKLRITFICTKKRECKLPNSLVEEYLLFWGLNDKNNQSVWNIINAIQLSNWYVYFECCCPAYSYRIFSFQLIYKFFKTVICWCISGVGSILCYFLICTDINLNYFFIKKERADAHSTFCPAYFFFFSVLVTVCGWIILYRKSTYVCKCTYKNHCLSSLLKHFQKL